MTEARVRPATVEDAEEIARIQLLTWQVAYSDVLPKRVLDELDSAETAEVWAHTLAEGPARVHVATEDEHPVGFCVSGPAPEQEVAAADGGLPQDADGVGLIGTLLVEPRWGRRGHGGRLLATAAQALRSDGASRGIAWVPEADQASVAFYTGVGWEADGTVRTLDADGQPLREVRLTGTLDLRLEHPTG
jgi:GNAT superfamily N-acetyltransferase